MGAKEGEGGFAGSVSKSERDNAFLDRVIETLRRGGNVLIPSDTAGEEVERWGRRERGKERGRRGEDGEGSIF